MRNTKLIAFVFGLIDILVVAYYWMRCADTNSPFYCDAFMFGVILYLLAFPGLLLLCIAILSWLGEKKFPSWVQTGLLVAALIIFLGPWFLALFNTIRHSDQPQTYRAYLKEMQYTNDRAESLQQAVCAEYAEYLRTWKEGEPLLTPPPGCGS